MFGCIICVVLCELDRLERQVFLLMLSAHSVYSTLVHLQYCMSIVGWERPAIGYMLSHSVSTIVVGLNAIIKRSLVSPINQGYSRPLDFFHFVQNFIRDRAWYNLIACRHEQGVLHACGQLRPRAYHCRTSTACELTRAREILYRHGRRDASAAGGRCQ